MPVYTYKCEKCKSDFEAFASIQKKEMGWKPVCPRCESTWTRQTFKPVVMVSAARGRPSGGGGCCSPREG
jgi:putative FmdB family regulatory protein